MPLIFQAPAAFSARPGIAVKAGCKYIITYNKRDFVGVEQFALQALEPGTFLQHIGALS